MQSVVFITGCSSGIGAALAQEFHQRGMVVYATARKLDSLAELAAQGMYTLAVDVNDDDSIAVALARVQQLHGRIDILVNNAGFSQVGAVIDLGREELRRQFETNVIAPIAVTRAAMGLLRACVAQGRRPVLANVGSIVGLLTTPFAGAYCSSKAALHALSDALRMELAPLGIAVVTIQPGGVTSSFGQHAQEAIKLPHDSLYQSVAKGIHARAQAGQLGATPARAFVVPVVDALLSTHPPVVVRGGTNSVRLPLLKKLLPTRVFDAKLSRIFGLDRLKADGLQ